MEWLVVGLGNPGKQYEMTRHNVGFMVVDEMAKRRANRGWKMEKKFSGQVVEIGNTLLLKPQTFMNLSGKAVAGAAHFYKIPADRIIVVHDDLDIPLGTVKAGVEKGPKVHHGLTSIEQQLGTTQFWRVRVGIEGRTVEEKPLWPGEKYVLLPLTAEERTLIQMNVARATQKVEAILANSINYATP